ncbi:hypothetical protein D9611_009074 [Ephemerocybe angulata]|uniref:Transmembrane protein n=1 Tax=Ephemerocybe angulata TaxID=980116 RepID=A0A8H5CFD0_9AGAR|nr:hypothetical protein D9611_009074 [Tulosesus angulatus]
MADRSGKRPVLNDRVQSNSDAGHGSTPTKDHSNSDRDRVPRVLRRRSISFRRVFTLLCTLSGLWFAYNRFFGSPLASGLELFKDESQYQLMVPPGIELEKCTKWDGQDEEPSYDGTTSTDYDYNAKDNTYWVQPPPLRSPPPPPKGDFVVQPLPDKMRIVLSSAEFNTSLDNDILFISTGNLAAGSFWIDQSEDAVGDQVQTRVEAMTFGDQWGHDHERFLGLARVCRIKMVGGASQGTGVGIFTPEVRRWLPWTPKSRTAPQFKIIVRLPKKRVESVNRSKLPIGNFQTHMPGFAHYNLLPEGTVTLKNFS